METFKSNELGTKVGEAGFQQFLDRADQIRVSEKERIETVTDIEAAPLRARIEVLRRRYGTLQRKSYQSATKTTLDVRWIRLSHGFMLCVLFTSGLLLCESTLSQFGLGPEVWVIAIGQAIALTIATDKLLEVWKNQSLLISLVSAAFVAGLVTLICLAFIRADLFALLIKQQLMAPGTDDQNALGEMFYGSTSMTMRIFTATLAIGMELVAGIMFHDLKIASSNRQPSKDLDTKLAQVEDTWADIRGKLHELENRGKAFEATFNRDLAIALLRRMKESGITKWFAAIVLCIFLCAPFAHAGVHTDVAVLFDLSTSMRTPGTLDTADKRKALTGILMSLPPDSSFIVVGITDKSFAQPQILLAGEIPADPGPLPLFNRIVAARRKLVAEVANKPTAFRPRYEGSDVIGAIKYAAEHFKATSTTPGTRILAILSDMRQVSAELNLERPRVIDVPAAIKSLVRIGQSLALSDVNVFVLSATTSGKSVEYWDSLKDFWTQLFRKSGAKLQMYSPTDDIPRLQLRGGGSGGSH